jgi:hypothetical protein
VAVVSDAACSACGTELKGRWCHACGTDNAVQAPRQRTLRVLFDDVADNVFSYTGQLAPTLRDLILAPGKLIAAQADLDRDSYLSPIKLYLTATAVLFLVLGWTGVSLFQLQIERTGGPIAVEVVAAPDGQDLRIEGFRIDERFLYRNTDITPDPAAVAALAAAEEQATDPVVRMLLGFYRQNASDPAQANAAANAWLPQVLWLLMPLHALLALPGKRKGTLIYDALVFSVAAHAMMVLLLLAGAAWNAAGLGVATGVGGLTAALAPCIIWSAVAMKGFFRLGWPAAALQAGAHTLLYAGLLVLPAIAVFVGVQVASFAPDGFWAALMAE